MIVSDTNFMIRLYVESSISPLAREAMLRDPEWAAPVLWRSEFRSTLTKGVRSKLLDLDDAMRIMAEAELMMLFREYDLASDDVLELAAGPKIKLRACHDEVQRPERIARNMNLPGEVAEWLKATVC